MVVGPLTAFLVTLVAFANADTTGDKALAFLFGVTAAAASIAIGVAVEAQVQQQRLRRSTWLSASGGGSR